MPLKDILVQLDASERSATRLGVAIDLARRYGAHLTGLHVADVVFPVGVVPDATGAGMAMMYQQLRGTALEAAKGIERDFHEQLRRAGIPGEWRLVEGMAAEQVPLHARYADLLVLGQDSPEGAGGLVEAAIFSAGRPVLVIPYAGQFTEIGQRVLVGWNGSREAARAVNDALPLLAEAAKVTVMAVNPRRGLQGEGDQPAEDLSRHLARHGLQVTAEHMVAPEVGDGEALLNAAAETSADLLVIGAYGHSRLREMVMGGVTRTLLRSMTLPVLMSH